MVSVTCLLACCKLPTQGSCSLRIAATLADAAGTACRAEAQGTILAASALLGTSSAAWCIQPCGRATRSCKNLQATHRCLCSIQTPLLKPARCAGLRVTCVQEQNVQPAVLAAAAKGDKLAKLEADRAREQQLAAMVCSLENKEACMACGS